MAFFLKFKWWFAGAALLIALVIWHQGVTKRAYNAAYQDGYKVARGEGETALAIANGVAAATDARNEKALADFTRLLNDRRTVREQQEKIITEQIIPAIEAQPDCSIAPEIIAAINSVREDR